MVVPHNTAYNILRPETAEALFVLHQVTGDPIYREWSYEIFQACTASTTKNKIHVLRNTIALSGLPVPVSNETRRSAHVSTT